MTRIFGEEIDKTKANAHYNQFVKIKKRSIGDIQKALGSDDEAIRYYSGRPTYKPVDEDLCFVFDTITIKRILDMIRPTDGSAATHDGIVLFNGARTQNQSTDPVTKEVYDVEGRPTVMIFAYKKVAGDKLLVEIDKGTEHPGTGTKKDDPTKPPARDIYLIPELFDPNEFIPLTITDF